MRRVAVMVTILGLLYAPRAAAQPEPEGPYEEIEPGAEVPAPPVSPEAAPPPYYPPPPGYPDTRRQEKEQHRQLHRWLKQNDPEYRGALSRRTSGIVVASVVGGAGLLVGVLAGMVWMVCNGLDDSACDEPRAWTIGGFITMGVGLGVGLPLAISGHGRVKEIRQRARMQRRALLPRVNISLRRRGAGTLGLTWEF